MNGQTDRCDRTAYVSGLQPTISDIELFEVFNRVAHVEKVIVRNGASRHALVVFKSVKGLCQALVSFQRTTLHGRQLHIRPLRESSHANNESITTMFEKAKNGGGGQKRQSSVNEISGVPAQTQNPPIKYPSSPPFYRNRSPNQQRACSSGIAPNTSHNAIRRNGAGNNRNVFQNETCTGGIMDLFDGQNKSQFSEFNQYHHHCCESPNEHNLDFDDYIEGAKRFDSLANLIRSSTATDPFTSYYKNAEKYADSVQRPRVTSVREKHAPPTWKMELQIKKESESAVSPGRRENVTESENSGSPQVMTSQNILAQIVHQKAEKTGDNGQQQRKNRPSLSIINPSRFHEEYPKTSSPVVTFAPHSVFGDKNPSSHDPTILPYRYLRVPQSAVDVLSPIDTNNCSFIIGHLGNTSYEAGNSSGNQTQRRNSTNGELSDMIVSTGNLRINPSTVNVDSFAELPPLQLFESSEMAKVEPAPWSPLNRLWTENGCNITCQTLVSPQFSPIRPKSAQEVFTVNSEEDEVFGSDKKQNAFIDKLETLNPKEKAEQKLSNLENINNSRLPSNSHSAAPSSEQASFIFPPEYPMCRHSSVPSIAHLVGDLSDFCPLSPHIVSAKILDENNRSHALRYEEDVDKTSANTSAEDIPKASQELQKVQESLEI